jgi:phosphinothricin acetyltransferase
VLEKGSYGTQIQHTFCERPGVAICALEGWRFARWRRHYALEARHYIPGVQIRHADPDRDAPRCAQIYTPFVRDTVISLEEEPPDAGELARRIERISRTHPWLVAEDGQGELPGFAYASLHRERASYRWATDVTVYVDPAQHRRGIGSALYTALLDLLVRQGYYVACAGVTLPNDASVGLHESLGFVLVGVYRRIGFKFGAWWDVGWWQKQLQPASDRVPANPGSPARL